MHRFRFVLLTVLAVFTTAAVAAQPTVRNLGTPVKSMSIRGSLLVRDPVTGRPTFYSGMYTSSGIGRLIRFDYAENAVEYYDLPGTHGAYGLIEGPDQRIYVGSILPARIFSFDPWTKEITDHGSAAGEEYIFELCTGPNGWVYGGTYPNAKVVAYDPVQDRMHDLGRMHLTQQYVGDLSVADNGQVFAGIFPSADLVAYDPVSGKRTSILPEAYKDATGVDPDAEGNEVYASVDGRLLIIDANTYEVLSEVVNPDGWVGTHRPMSGGPLVIHGLPEGYVRFNRTTMELVPFYTPKYSTYDNESRVAYTRTGGRQIFQAFNLTDGQLLAEVDISGDGEGMGVFSLGTGPDGCIYGGSESILHLFKYDPATGVLEDLGFPYPGGGGEFYSLHTHGGRLYMAAYSDSVLGVYEPSTGWDPGTSLGSNPRRVGSVGGEQNRPHAMTSSVDGRVFIGSEPNYGKHGGALSIYDPVADTFETHRHIVPNQTVLSLTSSLDGWTIFGGTSIRGGTGTEPITRRGHFFAWDVRLGKKTLDIVPVIASDDVSSLVTGPDGLIYGCAGSTLFVFDPAVMELVHIQSAEEGEITSMVVGRDGLIYGRGRRAVFRMRPLSEEDWHVRFELLYRGDEGRGLALDSAGRIYLGEGVNLTVIENLPPSEEPYEDLPVYVDDLSAGWSVTTSHAEVDLRSEEMVASGSCQKVVSSRFCTIQYEPPDPWDISLWGYDYVSFSVNPGEATITSLIVSKTGPGSGDSIDVLEAYGIGLSSNQWTTINVPVSDMDWAFGSRMESLKLIVLGSGTFYLDSISLRVSEQSDLVWVKALLVGGMMVGTKVRGLGRVVRVPRRCSRLPLPPNS